jgi:hypothetical protein
VVLFFIFMMEVGVEDMREKVLFFCSFASCSPIGCRLVLFID